MQAQVPGLVVERSAVHRFALESEASIREDISRISVISAVGIVLLFLVFYGSPRALILAFLPLVAGVVAATALSLAIFTELHGLTLAFGATLIGICIDYPAHYFTHLSVAGPGQSHAVARRVWPGLAIGAATTVLGFAGLAAASFPGIREIGVFSSVGIAAALLATRFIVPALIGDAVRQTRAGRKAGTLAARGLRWLGKRPRSLWVLPAAAAVVCGLGASAATFVDDASALNKLEPASLAQDERVRGRVSRMEAGRMLVARGSTLQEALDATHQVLAALEGPLRTGQLKVSTVTTFLWSKRLQAENARLIYGLKFEDLAGALTAGGFRPEAFGALRDALVAGPPPPLVRADLEGTPIARAVDNFLLPIEGDVGVLTFVQEVAPDIALQDAISGVDNVVYFDQQAFLARNYRAYRERIEWLVVLGLFGVFLALFARYRSPAVAAAAFFPAVLSAGCALSVVALMGIELHLLHLTGVLLVLSMGVDYGVFLAEGREDPEHLELTLVGLAIACASTVLAFGLLALSSNPAMRAVGLTTGLGVTFSLLLAPVTLSLLALRKETP